MNKQRFANTIKLILVFLCAAAIPVLLIVDSIQTRRYENLEQDVTDLERKQIELVEQNKQLITDISMLSSSDRIEKIAENELSMHKAQSDEIIRVEMNSSVK
jgi:cell division protein FtsL